MAIKAQNGAVFIAVLMVLVLLLVAGAAVSTIGVTEAKQALRYERQVQAHYIARSGADVLAEQIELFVQSAVNSGGEEAPDVLFVAAWEDAKTNFVGSLSADVGNGRFRAEADPDDAWIGPVRVDPGEDEEGVEGHYLYQITVTSDGTVNEIDSTVTVAVLWQLTRFVNGETPAVVADPVRYWGQSQDISGGS